MGTGVRSRPLGTFLMEQGDTAKAMQFFADLARKNPNNPETRYYHGASLAILGDLNGAVREFDAAIALDPIHTRSSRLILPSSGSGRI